eukprot:jgi/Chrzof1/843/Cz01g31030.t1
MGLRVRLARFGRRAFPHYKLFVAEAKAPRNGRHIDEVGYYNPNPAVDGNKHIGLNFEKIKYWLAVGAQPSDRVQYLLVKAGLIPQPPMPPRFRQQSSEQDTKASKK